MREFDFDGHFLVRIHDVADFLQFAAQLHGYGGNDLIQLFRGIGLNALQLGVADQVARDAVDGSHLRAVGACNLIRLESVRRRGNCGRRLAVRNLDYRTHNAADGNRGHGEAHGFGPLLLLARDQLVAVCSGARHRVEKARRRVLIHGNGRAADCILVRFHRFRGLANEDEGRAGKVSGERAQIVERAHHVVVVRPENFARRRESRLGTKNRLFFDKNQNIGTKYSVCPDRYDELCCHVISDANDLVRVLGGNVDPRDVLALKLGINHKCDAPHVLLAVDRRHKVGQGIGECILLARCHVPHAAKNDVRSGAHRGRFGDGTHTLDLGPLERRLGLISWHSLPKSALRPAIVDHRHNPCHDSSVLMANPFPEIRRRAQARIDARKTELEAALSRDDLDKDLRREYEAQARIVGLLTPPDKILSERLKNVKLKWDQEQKDKFAMETDPDYVTLKGIYDEVTRLYRIYKDQFENATINIREYATYITEANNLIQTRRESEFRNFDFLNRAMFLYDYFESLEEKPRYPVPEPIFNQAYNLAFNLKERGHEDEMITFALDNLFDLTTDSLPIPREDPFDMETQLREMKEEESAKPLESLDILDLQTEIEALQDIFSIARNNYNNYTENLSAIRADFTKAQRELSNAEKGTGNVPIYFSNVPLRTLGNGNANTKTTLHSQIYKARRTFALPEDALTRNILEDLLDRRKDVLRSMTTLFNEYTETERIQFDLNGDIQDHNVRIDTLIRNTDNKKLAAELDQQILLHKSEITINPDQIISALQEHHDNARRGGDKTYSNDSRLKQFVRREKIQPIAIERAFESAVSQKKATKVLFEQRAKFLYSAEEYGERLADLQAQIDLAEKQLLTVSGLIADILGIGKPKVPAVETKLSYNSPQSTLRNRRGRAKTGHDHIIGYTGDFFVRTDSRAVFDDAIFREPAKAGPANESDTESSTEEIVVPLLRQPATPFLRDSVRARFWQRVRARTVSPGITTSPPPLSSESGRGAAAAEPSGSGKGPAPARPWQPADASPPTPEMGRAAASLETRAPPPLATTTTFLQSAVRRRLFSRHIAPAE